MLGETALTNCVSLLKWTSFSLDTFTICIWRFCLNYNNTFHNTLNIYTIDFVKQVQDFYYEMFLNDDQEVQSTSVHYKSLSSRWLGFKMFNKKPRRNFRQRKNESSDEDENEKLSGGDAGKETEKADSKADLPRSNVSPKARECDSNVSDAEEPSVTALQSKDTAHQSKSNTLSFLDEKDCEYFITTSHTH